jgi:protein-tyrosine phosphatase
MLDVARKDPPLLSRRRLMRAAVAAGAGLALVPVLGESASAHAGAGHTEPITDPLTRFRWVEGAFNTRDFGGYAIGCRRTVVVGRMYRSSSLHHVTDVGVTQLAGLNLSVVADFRSHAELGGAGRADRLPAGVAWVSVPVGDPETTAAGVAVTAGPPAGGLTAPDPATEAEFRSYITSSGARRSFGDALRIVSTLDGRPFLWHCNSGTYRTGWASAALLTVLGVPRDQVYADFLLSNLPLGGTFAFPEYLDAAFDEANAVFGSFRRYLHRGLGVDQRTVARLRHALVD